MNEPVNEENLTESCKKLARRDPHLDFVFRTCGTPPLWSREPGFPTLIQIILEQQVSLASAASAFNKLSDRVGAITPENIWRLSDREFKECYFSRQKTVYARHLAEAVLDGKLDLKALPDLSDAGVRTELMKIKGIGIWTADIYLMMALLRPDIMPKGDLALHTAWQKLKKLPERPKPDEFVLMAKKWKPFRSAAARLLWHFYLNE